MIKRNRILVIVLALLVGVFSVFATGCTKKEIPESQRKKYVVFTGSGWVDDEPYSYSYKTNGSKTQIEVDVECEKESSLRIKFDYKIYYEDTGELYTGYHYYPIVGNYPTYVNISKYGQYSLYTGEVSGLSGFRYCSLKLNVYKPDRRVAPTVVFDPNGGTIEEVDGETRYVYKYDKTKITTPIIKLYDGDTEIDLPSNFFHINHVRDYYTDKMIGDSRPVKVGLYRVCYEIRTSSYKEADRDKYLPIDKYIIVEIRE